MNKKIIKIGYTSHDLTDNKCFKHYHTSNVGSDLPFHYIEPSFISNKTFDILLNLCNSLTNKSLIISRLRSINLILEIFIAIDYFQINDKDIKVLLYQQYRKLLSRKGYLVSTKMTDLYDLFPDHLEQDINNIITERIKNKKTNKKKIKLFTKLATDYKKAKDQPIGIGREPNIRYFYDDLNFNKILNNPKSKDVAVIYWHQYVYLCFGIQIRGKHHVVCNKYNIHDLLFDIKNDNNTIDWILQNESPILDYIIFY